MNGSTLLGARLSHLAATLFVILLGLALRKFGYAAHLPFLVVKYGGSVLWGAMVYLLLASIAIKARILNIAITAILVAVAVEFFRLYHTPWLDSFRLTTAGALLFGRVFSLWNVLAYSFGILAAFVIDGRLMTRTRPDE